MRILQRTTALQNALFPNLTAEFPSTRYQGSKAKLAQWIGEQITQWGQHIDHRSEHRRLKPQPSEWSDKNRIHTAFARPFERFRDSIIVVSYRSDGIPSESELASLLGRHKRAVRVEHVGQYKYVLSTDSESEEIILVGI
jgi:hypothetical protein